MLEKQALYSVVDQISTQMTRRPLTQLQLANAFSDKETELYKHVIFIMREKLVS